MAAKITRIATAAGIAAAALISACGGGGGSSTPAATTPTTSSSPIPEGSYTGTLTGSKNSAFQLILLENGDMWGIYGSRPATGFSLAGFAQGTVVANNGSLTSSNARDFGFVPPQNASMSAIYNTTTKTIGGIFPIAQSTVNFTGTAEPLYVYDQLPSIAGAAGSWQMTSVLGEVFTINLAATGPFSGTSDRGCSITGGVSPRASGKNVLNLAVSFGPAPCVLAGQTLNGIALSTPLSGGLNQLTFEAIDAQRSVSFGAIGQR